MDRYKQNFVSRPASVYGWNSYIRRIPVQVFLNRHEIFPKKSSTKPSLSGASGPVAAVTVVPMSRWYKEAPWL
jgi:hypothetical protein